MSAAASEDDIRSGVAAVASLHNTVVHDQDARTAAEAAANLRLAMTSPPHGRHQRPGRDQGHRSHHKEMLKSIGVDSIKELRHRNAAHLKEMIETRHGKVVGLSEKTCQDWIDAAKAHTP